VVGLSMAERKAVTRQMARRYQRASKTQKGAMLDELSALTEWTRRHARRALGEAIAGGGTGPRPRPGRPRIYGKEILEPLRRVWAALDGPSGKRLAPFLAEMVEVMERFGELTVDDAVRANLLRISPATIDRLLAAERQRLQVKGRSGTKPGSMLKRQIPIRTFAEWDEAVPGFCEVDLVAHDGGDARGEFCQTVDLTCVATGWTEMRAVPNKAQRWVFEALKDIRAHLPFPLKGLDSDNGSEFINDQLHRYCVAEEITFTRSRPYRKNDNCFVEQKNWSVIRQQVGYLRYDTPEELELLHELYSHLRYYVNFFQPQMRLVQKTREGAKVRKRYDTARTPYQRILRSPDVSDERKQALTAAYRGLNPVQLKRDIGRCQDRLLAIANLKPKVRPDGDIPGPGHPWKYAYARWLAVPHADISSEATNELSRTS
jgi:hypothetical protein